MDNLPVRMWINQPSTLQSLHHLHGTNVLAVHECDDTYRIYFLSGPIVSQQAPASALSPGWRAPSDMSKSIIYAAGIAHYWRNLNDEVHSYIRCQQLGMDVSDNAERVVAAWNEVREALLDSEARPDSN